MVESNSKKKI